MDEQQSPADEQHSTSHVDSMADTFAYLLMGHTQGKLSQVRWFRTDWQRGGALTGFGLWTEDDRVDQVVVKIPVPPNERHWLMYLQDHSDICPKLYAQGESLGGYDLAWVIMERMPHGPLNHQWEGQEFDLLIQATGRFYAASVQRPLTGKPDGRDWHAILDRARKNVHQQSMPFEQRWSSTLKQAHRKLDQWLTIWNERDINCWCHGDLHLGNAMTRLPPPQGPAILLDFAMTRPGHWIEDAIYCEHLFWARRARLGGRQLCSMIAKERKHHHLPVDANWPRLASVKRKLLAICTPALLQHQGDPSHLKACLEVLENNE